MIGVIKLFDLEIFAKFSKFLDYSKDSEENRIPTSELGLTKNAPKEAIEAYEVYKKWDAEQEPEEL